MNYAIVKNGIVENVVVMNNISNLPNAVFLDNLPVGIGDTYEDGVFYHNGERVIAMVDTLRLQIEELDSLLLDATYESILGGLE